MNKKEQKALIKLIENKFGWRFKGIRNAQVTLFAPNGTTSFQSDCSTTGIEPITFLTMTKNMVGGGTMTWTPRCIRAGLECLGYDADKCLDYLEKHGTLKGTLALEHLPVFYDANDIKPLDHVKMMASAQQWITGAISKTVNLDQSATIEDIEDIFMTAWNQKLKGITIYRAGSKSFAPLTASKINEDVEKIIINNELKRKRLPDERPAMNHKFEVGGHRGFIDIGFYPDNGEIGEFFITMSKEGSTLSGFMDSISQSVSIGLQYGIPLDVFITKFEYTNFEPSGITTNMDIPSASSLLDYIFRYLKKVSKNKFGGIFKPIYEGKNIDLMEIPHVKNDSKILTSQNGIPCSICGSLMVKKGGCFYCYNCNETTGCS